MLYSRQSFSRQGRRCGFGQIGGCFEVCAVIIPALIVWVGATIILRSFQETDAEIKAGMVKFGFTSIAVGIGAFLVFVVVAKLMSRRRK